MSTSTALVPVETQSAGMLMPLATATEAAAAIAAYEQLKAAIVRPDDKQTIQGRTFLKKSFWRRVATCFGLSLELVREERIIQDGALAYRVMYRAIAPNGRTMDSDGYCSTAEAGRGNWPEHNVRATAHTRAKNRAISDLVGGGEVSAEEMSEDDGARPPQRQQAQQRGKATVTPAAPDPWGEVRELSAQLCLSDDERTDLFTRHKKNRDKILAELRERYANERDADDGVTFEAEDNSGNGHSLEGLPVHSA